MRSSNRAVPRVLSSTSHNGSSKESCKLNHHSFDDDEEENENDEAYEKGVNGHSNNTTLSRRIADLEQSTMSFAFNSLSADTKRRVGRIEFSIAMRNAFQPRLASSFIIENVIIEIDKYISITKGLNDGSKTELLKFKNGVKLNSTSTHTRVKNYIQRFKENFIHNALTSIWVHENLNSEELLSFKLKEGSSDEYLDGDHFDIIYNSLLATQNFEKYVHFPNMENLFTHEAFNAEMTFINQTTRSIDKILNLLVPSIVVAVDRTLQKDTKLNETEQSKTKRCLERVGPTGVAFAISLLQMRSDISVKECNTRRFINTDVFLSVLSNFQSNDTQIFGPNTHNIVQRELIRVRALLDRPNTNSVKSTLHPPKPIQEMSFQERLNASSALLRKTSKKRSFAVHLRDGGDDDPVEV